MPIIWAPSPSLNIGLLERFWPVLSLTFVLWKFLKLKGISSLLLGVPPVISSLFSHTVHIFLWMVINMKSTGPKLGSDLALSSPGRDCHFTVWASVSSSEIGRFGDRLTQRLRQLLCAFYRWVDIVIKQNSSLFTLFVQRRDRIKSALESSFLPFCGLARSWLSRCDLAQRKNRLRLEVEFQRFPHLLTRPPCWPGSTAVTQMPRGS